LHDTPAIHQPFVASRNRFCHNPICRKVRLPEESDPRIVREMQPEEARADDGNQLLAPAQPQPWGRLDRKRLFLWVGVGVVLPGVVLLALHRIISNDSGFTVQQELPAKLFMAFSVSVATWIVSRIEKRPLASYGIPPRQAFGKRFWEGCVWGFAMLSAILLVLKVSGHFRIDSVALTGHAILKWALGWGVTFLAVAWHEELAFRGYWLFTMSRRMRFWPAAVFLSTVFAVAHLGNHGENILGILQVAEIGLLFCLTLRRTGNLWFAIGFHAAWDWAETFFYGTPDSGLLGVGRFLNSSVHGPRWLTGGSAGPEGSIVAILVILLCAALIHLRFPKAIYPDRPV
jgi:membrane protease YdiL (CAAX protease family)